MKSHSNLLQSLRSQNLIVSRKTIKERHLKVPCILKGMPLSHSRVASIRCKILSLASTNRSRQTRTKWRRGNQESSTRRLPMTLSLGNNSPRLRFRALSSFLSSKLRQSSLCESTLLKRREINDFKRQSHCRRKMARCRFKTHNKTRHMLGSLVAIATRSR